MKKIAFSQGAYIDSHKKFAGIPGLCVGLSIVWLDSKVKNRVFNEYVEREKIQSRVLGIQTNGDALDDMEGFFKAWSQERGCKLIEGNIHVREHLSYSALLIEILRDIVAPTSSNIIYGILSVGHNCSGHCMAWVNNNGRYEFFDANAGIYSEMNSSDFFVHVNGHLKKYYPEDNSSAYVIKMGPK
ncbi:C58 family peptidase [Scandinavium sp. H11S7]|uniref:C58 family peptidase n=1 Tax=Scandinavium hiltneri TaxID=2926519 RepID=A0ABT2E5I3_9ENTR|nr:C58 family peptidase [Scandinavium hiltneri]MCS2163139.1 C58 family peptidase [Scandinavium hiltneri]